MESRCRLCASVHNMDSLISIKDDSNEICEKLRKCCQLNIKMQDVLPKSICQECMENLNNSYKFYNKVKDAQETLEALHSLSKTQEETQPSLVQKNVEKRKSTAVEQERAKLSKTNEKKNLEITKEIKVEKHQDNENRATRSKQVSGNYIQEVYEILEISKQETDLQDSYERNVEDLNENVKDKFCNYQEESDSNEDVIIPDGDIKIEYGDVFGEMNKEDDEEEMEVNEDNETYALDSHLTLKSWKNYVFLCFMCDQALPNFIALEAHMDQIHNITDMDNFKYKCHDCEQIVPRYNGFLNHIRSKHHPDLLLKCDVCNLSCQNYDELSFHRSINCEEASNFPKIIPCSQCFKSFVSIDGLQKHHIKFHKHVPMVDRQKFYCNFCENMFLSKAILDEHIFSSHLNDDTYKCICNKRFKTFQGLQIHQTLHVEKKSFKCDFCEKTFHQKNQKTTHERVHTGELPYHCDQCDKRFRHRSAFNSHIKRHTGVKPYVCDYCDKSFADGSNRRRHMRIKHANHV